MNSTHLSADADFSGGNARVLDCRSDREIPEVHVAAVPLGAPEAVWFQFRVRPASTDHPPAGIRCVLRNYELLLGNHPGAEVEFFHPVFRTEKREWTRCESIQPEEQADGQIWASWRVPADEGEVRVAVSYPYVQEELNSLLRDTAPVWETRGVGVTESGAELIRLSNRTGRSGGEESGIYCVARQHAAETPGSWVLDGFLREMAERGDSAPLVWAVPFADPDAVSAGRPGKDSFPWDFNRAWGSKLFPKDQLSVYGSHPMRHEVKCLQHDLVRWTQRCSPRLVLDFHAPTVRDPSGIFCFLRDLDEQGNPDARHAPWLAAMEKHVDPNYKGKPTYPFIRSGRYPSRWSTARIGDFVNRALNLPMITVETSYVCSPHQLFTSADYQQAGRQFATAVCSEV